MVAAEAAAAWKGHGGRSAMAAAVFGGSVAANQPRKQRGGQSVGNTAAAIADLLKRGSSSVMVVAAAP